MKKFICGIVGFLFSCLFGSFIDKLVKKYKKKPLLSKTLPSLVVFIIGVIAIVLASIFCCLCFTWGMVVYDYLIAGDIKGALLTALIAVIGIIYLAVITDDLPRKK